MACWTPDGAGTRVAPVGQPKVLQREFEGPRRRTTNCLSPECPRDASQQKITGLLSHLRSPGEKFQNRHQHRAYIDAVGTAKMRVVERSPPLIEFEERS